MALTIGDAISAWCAAASYGPCDDGAQYVATLLSQQGLLSKHAMLDTGLIVTKCLTP